MAAARPAGPLSRRRVLAGALIFLVIAAVGLAALGGVFAYQMHLAHEEEARREAAMQAARQEAVNLMSLNYRTLDRDIQRILDGATGQLEQQFNNSAEQLKTVVPQVKAVTSGEVLSAGVVNIDGGTAEVLLVVDQTVRNEAQGSSGGGSGGDSQGGSGSDSQGDPGDSGSQGGSGDGSGGDSGSQDDSGSGSEASGSASQGDSGGGSPGNSGGGPQESLKHYRMSMTLKYENGRWLASKLEFL